MTLATNCLLLLHIIILSKESVFLPYSVTNIFRFLFTNNKNSMNACHSKKSKPQGVEYNYYTCLSV